MPFTNDEAVDMIAVYFECFQNAALALRIYRARYPNRHLRDARIFPRLVRNLRNTGNFRPQLRRHSARTMEDNIVNVLAYVEWNPHVSTRAMSLALGISRTTILNILQDHRLHPYHMVLHQALNEVDFDRRLDYCHWMLGMIRENREFLSEILWTDEATFRSDGNVNLHNMHYWSNNNPHWLREVQHQGHWSLNVWCGILGGTVIGPYFFDQPLNGAEFFDFVVNQLPILLEDVPLQLRQNMFLQLDGCPAHFSRIVREHLDLTYQQRWIGRGSLFPWPPRSPDLTCLDFYLWGRIKDIVYQIPPTTRDDMKIRIQEAIHSLSRVEIEAAVMSTHQRLQKCIECDGIQFEHLRRH